LLVSKICTTNKNSNCDNVLDSPAANLLGILSWAEIGLTYFISLIFLLVIRNGVESVTTISVVSIVASPFIAYSLYQQGMVLKSWCKLCLLILFALLLNTILAIIFLSQVLNLYQSLNLFNGAVFILCFTLLALIISFFNGAYQELVDLREKVKYTNKLKFTESHFETALKKSEKISILDIAPMKFGNLNSDTTIMIVTNPFCRPCRELHNQLFSILKYKTNILVNEILLPEDNADAIRASELMLEVRKNYDAETSQEIIENYYKRHFKNVDQWIRAYDLNIKISTETREHLKQYIKWGVSHNVSSTPVVFFNEHRLPTEYSLLDLDYVTY